jgi:hypothetical protein
MADKIGMNVRILASLPAPGFYTLNHPLNPAPDVNFHDVCFTTPHAATTLPANSRSVPHGGDLCYLKTTTIQPLDLGGGKTGKPGPNTVSANASADSNATPEEARGIVRKACLRTKKSPAKALQSNRLPAPNGPFYGVLRLYLPKPEVTNGQWQMPFFTPENLQKE